jgi:hypothetical protein
MRAVAEEDFIRLNHPSCFHTQEILLEAPIFDKAFDEDKLV